MIGITMGDPNGVGPEIILKSFYNKKLKGPFVVIGDFDILNYCAESLELETSLRRVTAVDQIDPGSLNVLDENTLGAGDLTIGQVSEKGGRSSLAYIDKATELALSGRIQAIVTLPVNKEAIRLVNKGFQGHTDHIAARCSTTKYTMMLVSDRLIVTHVSMHVPMKRALELIKRDPIIDVIHLTGQAVNQLRRRSRIAVAGINPHAGEHGAFGREEIEEIEPAVRKTAAEGLDVYGPIPPDTVFYQAVNGKYDAVVCMYHDQGHIPMKLIDFDQAVNVTLGLPFVRTSVDHGTAYDIAWQGKASAASFINAFYLAGMMIQSKDSS